MATPSAKDLSEVVVDAGCVTGCLSKQASSARDGLDSRNCSAVEEHLGDSVYALAVKQVVRSGWKMWTWRILGALCFTIVLQLALIGLLWQV